MFDRLSMPIIQGPMLGVSDARLAIAVSSTGALGSLAGSNLPAPRLRETIAHLRSALDRPFLVNLFAIPPAEPTPGEVSAAIERLRPWRDRYGLAEQAIPNEWAEDFASQFDVLVAEVPPVASFTFGLLTQAQAEALRSKGIFVIGTATSVAEARAWVEVGADAICAQGAEAGGHRGTFLGAANENLIGTLSLTRTIRTAVDIPVIAAGGITDGAAIAAALALGADAVQVGTAYLLSDEALTNATWRKSIETAGDDPTRLTRAISGRYARGIENEFMRVMRPVEHEIPAYPVQNALTQELRAAASAAGSPDVLSLWAGQSVKLATSGSAADITTKLWGDAQECLRQTSARWSAGPG